MDDKNSTTNSFLSKSEHSTAINLEHRLKRATLQPQPFLLSEIFNVQRQLNQSLIKNQVLLSEYLSKKNTKEQKKQPIAIPVEKSGNIQILHLDNQHQEFFQKKGNSKSKARQSSQDQYQPAHQLDTSKSYKVSQTKNIPKNFGKAIIRYIRKNQKIAKKILDQFRLCEIKFYRMLDSYKEKINTIAELRSLWIEEENQFAKVLRILSMKYLRKHSLGHIFNSRVENYGKHIKYRLKIMKAIQNPKQFTYIKEF